MARVALAGSAADPQVRSVARHLAQLGVESVVWDASGWPGTTGLSLRAGADGATPGVAVSVVLLVIVKLPSS